MYRRVSSMILGFFSSSAPGRLRRLTRICLRYIRGGADDVEHAIRLGEHRDVTALKLVGCGAHSLGEKTLQIGMHGVVFFPDDVPTRLRLPGGPPGFRVEQVWFRDALDCPNELLLLLRKI